jgi:hypothetical protein
VTEGETFYPKSAGTCCGGLTGILTTPLVSQCPYSIDSGLRMPDPSLPACAAFDLDYAETHVCTKCGDGVCGPGESECNCPLDCPVSADAGAE